MAVPPYSFLDGIIDPFSGWRIKMTLPGRKPGWWCGRGRVASSETSISEVINWGREMPLYVPKWPLIAKVNHRKRLENQ
jgi:hypothetical protein